MITPRTFDECTNTPCWECSCQPDQLDPLRMDMGCEQRAGYLQERDLCHQK